ncbi:MAG: glycoside hydrolase family 28 protein [Pirellulales bacterium]|nr:glycoside hydrolase family 28 protein [Pirellulales bacterium]
MKHLPRILLVLLACSLGLSTACAAEQIFDIRDQGAVPDGKTLCTAAIQKAIDRCADAGGGTVYLPPGIWLSGTIELRSGVALKLEAGCRLLGSPNLEDYPPRVSKVPTYTEKYTARSLIHAADVENVAICGRGTIDGNASKFPINGRLRRPFGIRMIGCRDILVEDVTLRDSAMWMQHYLACERVRIRRISVYNHTNINNDGLDIDGCRDFVVSDCVIDTDDDSIVLKSSGDRKCENVTVANCVLSSHCAALKLGTESSGGFRNITFSNCAVFAPRGTTRVGKDPANAQYRRGGTGINLGMYDGAALENVTVSNITLDGVRSPIVVHLNDRGRMYRDDLPKPAVGILRNVILSNIAATDAKAAISVSGLPGRPIENLQLSNIHVTLAKGEDEQASGLICRDVAGLKIRDVCIRTDRSELNNAVTGVKGLLLDGLDVQLAGGATPALKLQDCPGAVVRNSVHFRVETPDESRK